MLCLNYYTPASISCIFTQRFRWMTQYSGLMTLQSTNKLILLPRDIIEKKISCNKIFSRLNQLTMYFSFAICRRQTASQRIWSGIHRDIHNAQPQGRQFISRNLGPNQGTVKTYRQAAAQEIPQIQWLSQIS